MAEPTNPLIAFSNAAAQVVERSASSIVAVHGGGRWPSSGIHWRSGVIVTAEEVLERDEDIKVVLPGGRVVAASLAGRDASTDVAVLRFQPDGLAAAPRQPSAIDVWTGKVLWKTYMVPSNNHGSDSNLSGYYSGNAVWASNPVVDPARGLLYVGTGNN